MKKLIAFTAITALNLVQAQNSNLREAKPQAEQTETEKYLENLQRTNGVDQTLTNYGFDNVWIKGLSNPGDGTNTRLRMTSNGESHFPMYGSNDRVFTAINQLNRPAIGFFVGTDAQNPTPSGYSGASPSLELNKDGSVSLYQSVWGNRPASSTAAATFGSTMAYKIVTFEQDGKVTIGNTRPSLHLGTYKLSVDGKMVAQRYICTGIQGWADYVFDTDYKLRSLDSVSTYIKQNKHLPNVPTEAELMEKGLDASEMLKVQMEKIEELYLHAIAQNKTIAQQQHEIAQQKTKTEAQATLQLQKMEELLAYIKNQEKELTELKQQINAPKFSTK